MPATRMPGTLPLVLSAALVGCSGGLTPHARAAGRYAQAAEASGGALGTAPAFSVSICEQMADLSYLEVRLGLRDAPAKISFFDYYTKATTKALVGGRESEITYEQYCNEFKAAGSVFSRALGATLAYAAALRTLVAGAEYDGDDITAVAANASAVAARLSIDAVAKPLKDAAGPLGKLSAIVVGQYAEKASERFIAHADPEVQAILAGLEGYLDAVEAQLGWTEQLERQVLVELEKKGLFGASAPYDVAGTLRVPATAVDAVHLLEFYRFGRSTKAEMRRARAVLDGYRHVLVGLRNSHRDLAKACSSGRRAELRKVSDDLAEFFAQLKDLNAALVARE